MWLLRLHVFNVCCIYIWYFFSFPLDSSQPPKIFFSSSFLPMCANEGVCPPGSRAGTRHGRMSSRHYSGPPSPPCRPWLLPPHPRPHRTPSHRSCSVEETNQGIQEQNDMASISEQKKYQCVKHLLNCLSSETLSQYTEGILSASTRCKTHGKKDREMQTNGS